MTLSGKTGPVAHSAQIFVGTGLVSRLEASLGSHQQHIRISDDRSIALVSTPIPYKFVIGACQPFQTEIAFAGILLVVVFTAMFMAITCSQVLIQAFKRYPSAPSSATKASYKDFDGLK